MKTRRSMFPKRDTLNAFRQAAACYHKRTLAALKQQKMDLRNSIAALSIVVICASALGQQPPPFPNPAGRQNPYLSTVAVMVTQDVRTVYQLKFLRTIEMTTNSAETNFVLLRTNLLSCVTNTSPVKLE